MVSLSNGKWINGYHWRPLVFYRTLSDSIRKQSDASEISPATRYTNRILCNVIPTHQNTLLTIGHHQEPASCEVACRDIKYFGRQVPITPAATVLTQHISTE